MMQAFDALLGGQRAGSARAAGSDASRSTGARDDADASGGFDRMLQARGSRDAASNPASRMSEASRDSRKAASANTPDAKPREAESSHASDETTSAESKTKDAARETSRAESKDDAPRESDSTADQADATPASGDETNALSDDATDTAAASTATTNDTATAALPEQMLALLNGLAGATSAPSVATPATGALPTGVLRGDVMATTGDSRGGTAAAPVLSASTGALPSVAAPTESDATAAFAMPMSAMASSDAKTADAMDAPLDTTVIGDTTPMSPLSVSTMGHHPLSRATTAAVQANAPIAMDDGFDDGFASRIGWMADQKIGHAEIRVTPDHLGVIDVRLSLDGNRVNAEFHSAQPDVRHALESSLPRLRDMLGQQGLQLGHADVGQRHTQQQGAQGQASSQFGGGERSDATNDAGWTRAPAMRASRGLLDEYA